MEEKVSLHLSRSVEDLILALKEHLSDPALPVEPQQQLQSEDEDPDGGYNEFDPVQPPEKRACPGEDDDDGTQFSFCKQGQWVAVLYDDQFYIGQVIEVAHGQSAVVKYLEQTKGQKDYYR